MKRAYSALESKVLGRVAAYVRVSTEEQAEGHSLDSQVDACLQFAKSRGCSGFEVYRDAGFSAKTADRPAFLRLIEDAEAGMVDTVVVFKLDRFARNRLDSLLHKKRLRDAGVRLYSVTESFDEGPSGLIAEGMLELIAEWYSADLKHKVTQGKRKRAEKGLMNGPTPFGYRQEGDPRVDPPQVDQSEGAAVRMVYEAFSTGMVTYGSIAERLNAEGFRTRHRAGRRSPDDGPRLWSGDSVRALIQNPVYKGVVTRRSAILFADLAISEAQYQSERTRLESELIQLEGAAPDAELASAELDVLQLAWSKASPQEKRSLALALFEAVYVDLETMEIASYVLRPAFRPWVRSPEPSS